MAYSNDLRSRVLALYDEGLQTKPIAQRLKVSPAWARRVKQHRDRPRPRIGGSRPKLDESARAQLDQWIAQTPDATLDELRQRLGDELSIRVSVGCLWNTLRRMKLTYKKSR